MTICEGASLHLVSGLPKEAHIKMCQRGSRWYWIYRRGHLWHLLALDQSWPTPTPTTSPISTTQKKSLRRALTEDHKICGTENRSEAVWKLGITLCPMAWWVVVCDDLFETREAELW